MLFHCNHHCLQFYANNIYIFRNIIILKCLNDVMLLDRIDRVITRSTAELTAEELGRLFNALSGSETIKRYEYDHRPKGGTTIFNVTSMFLLYLFMECRRQT